MKNIGKNIKRLREANNLTQEDLAEKLDVTRSCVSGWEVGRNEPGLLITAKLIHIFHTTFDELVQE